MGLGPPGISHPGLGSCSLSISQAGGALGDAGEPESPRKARPFPQILMEAEHTHTEKEPEVHRQQWQGGRGLSDRNSRMR